jgi:choline kinase
MKALILNSGTGNRLRPLTDDRPKALLEVGSKCLLGHQLDNLVGAHIKHIIMTTGPFADKIKVYMKEAYPSISVSYVFNPRYAATNYIYSLWLAKKLIDEAIILLHGDLLFNSKLLDRLIAEKYENCVLVNREIKAPEKDFKAVIEDERVVKIGVGFSGENAFFSAPIYKFSKSSFLRWLEEIGKFVRKGLIMNYAEDALNKITDTITLHPIYYNDEFCMEIDTREDLETANSLLGGTKYAG